MSWGGVSAGRSRAQADIGLPLFMGTSTEYALSKRVLGAGTLTYEKRYLPSAAVTFGIGWRR